jgi:hypothetical protein
MRILNQDNDKALKNIMILLTPEEASEMRGDLEKMLQESDANNHTHISDILYKHEMTVAIYNEGEANLFNERTKKLILMDD